MPQIQSRNRPNRQNPQSLTPSGMAILATLRRLGYEVGSGVMIGIPGQTYDDLADDIECSAGWTST